MKNVYIYNSNRKTRAHSPYNTKLILSKEKQSIHPNIKYRRKNYEL